MKPRRKRSTRRSNTEIAAPSFLSGKPARRYELRLYVAGSNLNSVSAIKNLRQLCDRTLKGRVSLEVIDLYQQPALAARDHVVAAPTLIKLSPSPRRIFIGDMSNEEQLLSGMGIRLSQLKKDVWSRQKRQQR